MFDKKETPFKCIIHSVNESPGPNQKCLNLTEDIPILLDVFIERIQREYELLGEVTIWRSEKDERTPNLVLGQEVTDLHLYLADNETIFVLYDKEVEVIPGGIGMGASGKNGLAFGGHGGGGSMTEDGDKRGGHGIGGKLIGKEAVGTAGAGRGGTVQGGVAGAGVGGKILRRNPKGTGGQGK